MYGVTPFQLLARHSSTSRRMSLISVLLLAALASDVEVERLLVARLPLLLTGTGMNDSLGRRPGRTFPVGPCGPSSKCASGGS